MSNTSLEASGSPSKTRRKSGPKLSTADRAAIAALVLAGHPKTKIAEQFNINRNTVATIADSVEIGIAPLRPDWRQVQTSLAVQSVNRALLDGSDTYKSAGIATQALKGLGVYSPDVVNQAAIVVQNLPNEVKELCAKYDPLPATDDPNNSVTIRADVSGSTESTSGQ